MALDNLVLPEASSRRWRAPRVVELSVVAALTVAVVVVGALWGAESGGTADALPVSSASGAPLDTASISGAAELAPPTVVQSAPIGGPGGTATAALPAQSGSGLGWSEPLFVTLPTTFERYQVQRGETLFAVASAVGVSIAELLHWNRQLNGDSVLIRGEWLWIPGWDRAPSGKSGHGGG